MPDVMMIPAGTLDDPSWVKPAMQIYCDSAQPWVKLEGDMQRFPGDARTAELTHSGRSPRRAVDGHHPPAVAHARALDPVDAGDRAVVDRKGEGRLGIKSERQAQRRADRAAMRHGDDVSAADGPSTRRWIARDTRSMTATKLSPPGGA